MHDDPAQPHHAHTNRLARETSPYLLQHQHNPVDWYPWGPEAFARARAEDKPIFLSVGYSTCYWCHVMERQCFESQAVAEEMNKRFINVKVDREERPDVDQLYMIAVQVLTHHGGWPMSVWMTPDLRPFYGGTYYPPADQQGRPGFVTLLHALEDAYKNRRSDVLQTADQLVNILRQFARPAPPREPVTVDDAFIANVIQSSVADYDATFGGFGGAPKFPRETLLELLLIYAHDDGGKSTDLKSHVREIVLHTLDSIAAGGIRDQLGGGFHRYSTDARWLVPHFEIMLYDNALLGWCYAEAFRQTAEPRYADVARGVFDFVLREMTSPEGAFCTALDAEVDGQEGLNYLWILSEVEHILGPEDAKFFARVYGLDRGPNFADPHHGTGVPDKNILYVPESIESVARTYRTTPAELESRLAPMRQKLKAARDKRKQPLLDTKILTSWNALMIRALAHGSRALGQPHYLAAARRAAELLLEKHRTPAGGLYRTSRDGQAKYDAFLDDYSYLAQALLALEEAGAGAEWRDKAQSLSSEMLKRFGDEESGGALYFTDKSATDLIVRQKVAGDSPLPSGNASAAIALLSLGRDAEGRAIIADFLPQMHQNGEGMSAMVQAALCALRQGGEPIRVEPAPRGAAAASADRPLSPGETAESVVRVACEWNGRQELFVRLSILHGFHINSDEPGPMKGKDQPPLVATRLLITGVPPESVMIGYPPGVEMPLAFADQPVQVYSGDVTLAVRFTRPQKTVPAVSLTYQACDNNACLPPVTRKLDVPTPPAS